MTWLKWPEYATLLENLSMCTRALKLVSRCHTPPLAIRKGETLPHVQPKVLFIQSLVPRIIPIQPLANLLKHAYISWV